ncbi:MAG: shikimate kinase [Myxococcota bacterium]
MNERCPIWLVGMMGSGKSTLAPSLARRLGRLALDADAAIEERAGRSVAEIFEAEGETGFRDREASLIGELEQGDAVVALGGGAMSQPGMGDRLLRSGIVVFLRARPEVLLERVGRGSARPLLRGLDSAARLARLSALAKEREADYARAQITLCTEELDPSDMTEVIEGVASRIEALGRDRG